MDDLRNRFEEASRQVRVDVTSGYEKTRSRSRRRSSRRRLGAAVGAVAIAVGSTLFVVSAFGGGSAEQAAGAAPDQAYLVQDDASSGEILVRALDVSSGDVTTVQSIDAAGLEIIYPDMAVSEDALYLGATLKDESEDIFAINRSTGEILSSATTSNLPGTQVPTDYIFPLPTGGAFVYHTDLSTPSTFTNSLNFYDLQKGSFRPWSIDLGGCNASGQVFPISDSSVAVYCGLESQVELVSINAGVIKVDDSVALPPPHTNRIGLNDAVVAGSVSVTSPSYISRPKTVGCSQWICTLDSLLGPRSCQSATTKPWLRAVLRR